MELANVYYVQASTMISHSNQTFKYEQVDAYKNLQLTLQYTYFNQLVVSTYGIWKVTLDKEESDNAADVVAAAAVIAAADNATDVDENTGDNASDLEPEPTVPKASTTKKVAVPKTSKKKGPRGPYKKKSNNSFLLFSLLNYYIIMSKLLFYFINY